MPIPLSETVMNGGLNTHLNEQQEYTFSLYTPVSHYSFKFYAVFQNADWLPQQLICTAGTARIQILYADTLNHVVYLLS